MQSNSSGDEISTGRDDDVAGGDLSGRDIEPMLPQASSGDRKKLLTALCARGLPEPLAAAVSKSVVNPAATARALADPTRLRVAGGVLEVVSVRVFNGSVVPTPTNPRVTSRVAYPAGEVGPDAIAPLLTTSDPQGAPALTVEAANPKSLSTAMEVAANYVVENNDLRASVANQGVMLPLTLVATTFAFTDGSPARSAVTSVDGSSRLTAALALSSLAAADVVLDADTVLSNHRTMLRDLHAKDERSLTDTDLGILRTGALPAQLVVGWSAQDDRLDFNDLVDAYLGLIHVVPPTPWGEAASGDKRADSILDELEREGRIGPQRRKYLAGLLTSEEALESGEDPTLDGRAVEVFFEVARRKNAILAHRALQRLGERNPNRDMRLSVATELAIRPYRLLANNTVRRNPRTSLPIAMRRFMPSDWSPPRLPLSDLLAAALTEHESHTIGPATNDLAIRGAFWLTRFASLQKSSRTDTRFSDELLEDIATTEHGLRVLNQAILDGRAGVVPRQARDDGSLLTNASGQTQPVTDRWLRDTFPPRAPGDDAEDMADDWSPLDEFRDRLYGLRADSESLVEKYKYIEEIRETDDAPTILSIEGIAQTVGETIVHALNAVRVEVEYHMRKRSERG